MSDIPSFEPNWNLDDPNIIGQNADAFVTIEETLARIKLIKEVGLVNLYEKGVLVKDPYCSVYDMVSAIKSIPISNGRPRTIPKQFSGVKILPVKSEGAAWVTSLPFIIETYAPVKTLSINSYKDGLANPYYVNFQSIAAGETGETFIKSREGDSLFCFIFYSMDSTEIGEKFTLSDDWTKLFTTSARVINNVAYYIGVFMRNSKATGFEENCQLINNSNTNIDMFLVDFWDFSSKLVYRQDLEGFGSGQLNIKKDTENNILWLCWNGINDNYGYHLSPDSLYINKIYKDNKKRNMLFLDRADMGERFFTYDGSETYAFSAAEFMEVED